MSPEPYRFGAQKALALVSEFPLAAYLDRHASPMIGQMEDGLGHHDRQWVGSFQAEEIDPGAVGISFPNISPEVQLGKSAGPGNMGYPAQLNPVHPEGDDAHPGGLIESVYLQAGGKQRFQFGGGD